MKMLTAYTSDQDKNEPYSALVSAIQAGAASQKMEATNFSMVPNLYMHGLIETATANSAD